jgi:hypothetical protein
LFGSARAQSPVDFVAVSVGNKVPAHQKRSFFSSPLKAAVPSDRAGFDVRRYGWAAEISYIPPLLRKEGAPGFFLLKREFPLALADRAGAREGTGFSKRARLVPGEL